VGWVGSYLVPVVVILVVAIYSVALVMWALGRWPDPFDRDRWQ
jgi:hypothetical protein